MTPSSLEPACEVWWVFAHKPGCAVYLLLWFLLYLLYLQYGGARWRAEEEAFI